MKKLKIITMTIDDEGNPTVETDGYEGKGCDAVQQIFGAAIGTTEKSTKKPEYNRLTQLKKVCVNR